MQKDKTSILNPIQHIKLNQQLTTVTEEIEELKSRKEQLIFQAQCSTDKDMTNLSKKYDQMNNNLDILDSQDISLEYYGAAEPPVRCGESHLSGLTEPLHFVY